MSRRGRAVPLHNSPHATPAPSRLPLPPAPQTPDQLRVRVPSVWPPAHDCFRRARRLGELIDVSCVSVVWASLSGQCSVVGAPGLGRSSRWRVRGLFQFVPVANKAPVGVCVRISAGTCASVSPGSSPSSGTAAPPGRGALQLSRHRGFPAWPPRLTLPPAARRLPRLRSLTSARAVRGARFNGSRGSLPLPRHTLDSRIRGGRRAWTSHRGSVIHGPSLVKDG